MNLKKRIKKFFWYLFAIDIIDTQVARRGRQYQSNPKVTVKFGLSLTARFGAAMQTNPLNKLIGIDYFVNNLELEKSDRQNLKWPNGGKRTTNNSRVYQRGTIFKKKLE